MASRLKIIHEISDVFILELNNANINPEIIRHKYGDIVFDAKVTSRMNVFVKNNR